MQSRSQAGSAQHCYRLSALCYHTAQNGQAATFVRYRPTEHRRKAGTHRHQIRLTWFTLYAAWLQAERADFYRLLVAADLKIAPLDIDVWEPACYRKRNLTSSPERAAFDHLLDAGDLVDIVRDAFGDEPVFTWWNRRSDFYETDRGWRLDHLGTSPDVASHVDAVIVDRAERGRPGSTDHAPVTMTLV